MYILDPNLNLCPIGVPGEICIGGTGLARGYLNDPEKTAGKFIQFPLTGKRIYKTGDSGRIRADGIIEFLGRLDEQVKIRGYRVELTEIENRLSGMKGIKECAATYFGEGDIAELVVYFTADMPLDSSILKNHLEAFLPDYMMPSCFVQLKRMPLSVNGKIDKKALPAPSSQQLTEDFRFPADETEAALIRICSEIMKKDRISLNANFFGIGGNSLNAVRLISRLQKEWGITLSLKEVFYHPILADLAEILKKSQLDKTSEEIPEPFHAIVPASGEELEILSGLEFDDEDE
jgi:acyl carrier protein